jgi:tRNA G37 N-methylase Trm5
MDREGPPEKLTHNNEKEKMRALETFVWQHDVSSEEFSLALHIAEDTDAKITSLDKRLQNCIQEIKAAIEHGVQRETLEELLKKIERVEVSSYQGLVGEIAFLNVRNEEKEALINLVKTPISSNIKATFADGTTRIFSLPVVLLTTNTSNYNSIFFIHDFTHSKFNSS